MLHADCERWLVRGDLSVPGHQRHYGDLITAGSLRLGPGCWIHGGVKSNGDLYIGKGARIDGPIIGAGAVHIGARCQLAGPIVSERIVHLGAGTRIGTFERPTTLSTPRLVVAPGVMAHGTIWARTAGEVVA